MDELYINPINYLQKLNKKQIVELLKEADIKYTNTDTTLFTDELYDIIKEYLKDIDPKNEYFKRVGADEENKVKLPFYLGSQDKLKEDKDIKNWIKKYNKPLDYIIDEKLDGISCLLYYDKGAINIYTRGNGKEGQNISFIKSHIKGIPDLDKELKVAIRGELIISKENWGKIKDCGSNARNVVAGAIHSKIINNKIMNNIEFIAYDLLYPRKPLKEALEYIKSLKINVVNNINIIENLTIENLLNHLNHFRKISKYEIDGIVITHNKEYKLEQKKNPPYSFAFKSILNHEQAEVIVTEVEWNVSKDRYLKPLVKFNEILLNGVKIKQATGFNANFIETNNIGIGSRIIIIRSGDVIPHIYKIISHTTPSMPDLKYKWNDTRVDILLDDNEKNKEQDIQSFLYFMKTLNISNIGEGIITKLYNSDYNTLEKIIKITVPELLKIDGIKKVSAEKIFNSLKEIHNKDCISLLNASNTLGRGFGEGRIKLIYDTYPFIFSNRQEALKLNIENLVAINGISNIIATQFITNLPIFYEFYDKIKIKCNETVIVKKKVVDNIYKDKVFVLSGFRNKEFEEYIISNGGTFSNTITKKTSYLIVKNKEETTTKVKKANENNIPIITIEELKKIETI